MYRFFALLFFSISLIISFEASAQATSGKNSATLTVKQKTKVNNFKIQFIKVLEDSRCPTGSQCLVAGTVSLLIRINKQKETLTTRFDGLVVQIGSKTYRIDLKEVLPYPKSGEAADFSKYQATLTFTEI